MNRYILLAVSIILFYSCTEKKVILNEEQKNADAVYLTLSEEFQMTNTGEQSYINSSQLLLQTHASFNRLFGDSHIDYDPQFQNFKVLKAETDNSMGKSVVKENAINDILPKEAGKTAYYNRLRTKVVSHMGTEIGAVIKFDYLIESAKGYKPGLFENIVINQAVPVKERVIRVIVPQGTQLKYKAWNTDVKPVVTEDEGNKVYTWTFADVPALCYKGKSFDNESKLTRIVFSALSENSCGELVNESGLLNDSKVFFEDKVGSLYGKRDSDLEKIKKIQDEVNANIGSNKISFQQASYRLRNAEEIWKDMSASPAERAVLLKEMCRAAGFDAKLVIIVSPMYSEYAALNPNVWGEFCVYIKDINDGILLRAGVSNKYSYNYELGDSKIFDIDSFEFIDLKSDDNVIKGDIRLNINSARTVWGNAEIHAEGMCSNALAAYDYNSNLGLFPSSKWYKKISNEGFSYYYEKKADMISDDYFYIDLPKHNNGLNSYVIPLTYDEICADIVLKAPIEESYTYSLVWFWKYRPLSKFNDVSISNSVGEVNIRYTAEKFRLNIEKSVKIKKAVVSPDEYDELRELIVAWNSKDSNRLIFTKR